MTEAFVYDAVRTPRGRGKNTGSLHGTNPVSLVVGLREQLRERNAELDPSRVEDVVLGCVTPVGEQGANVARTAALVAGYEASGPGFQINRCCASGLEAVNIAAQKVRSGWEDLASAPTSSRRWRASAAPTRTRSPLSRRTAPPRRSPTGPSAARSSRSPTTSTARSSSSRTSSPAPAPPASRWAPSSPPSPGSARWAASTPSRRRTTTESRRSTTWAKDTFFAGGDLRLLSRVTDENAAEFGAGVARMKSDLRRLETLGRPVVAALNGAALGGGLEVALACDHRVALDDPKAQFGFPEVTLGLLPGAGGVVRTVRMLGIADALMKLLLQGTRYSAADAVGVAIVDELAATPEQLLQQSRVWIKANPAAVQPWDAKGYRMPGGLPSSPKLASVLPAFPANLRKQLKGAPMPAPHHIMCAAVEGATVDIDTAFAIEGRYFLNLATGQVAKNMIQAFWFDLNSINAGGSRPAGYEPRPARKVAVLGAGMMGAGIAYVSACNGIEVVLKDVSVEVAERGKAYSRKILDKAVSRGKLTEAKRDEVLARIAPTADYADLAGCDLVVEAVFENVSLKHRVFAELEPIVNPDALLGSNTSTLPITGLAEGVRRKADFIGLHFFSPVDKMPLLEIIRGEQSSDAALARALDYAKQIKKTPIVVNDSRGFFTSRVIGTFVNEALAMLGEGIAPATIEQATTQAGYPVGALQLADELNSELYLKIRDEAREAQDDSYTRHPAEDVVKRMVELGRPGRLRGKGFYDYDDTGRRTGLWTGLAEHFPLAGDPAEVDLRELGERMLVIEAVESARCVEENVLITTADANIGSIMGIGFPPWTGGVLQYVNGFPGGVAAFVSRADEFAGRYGARFEPNPLLRKKAENGESF